MANLYNEIADMFMESLAGQMSGITRDDFMARLKQQCPDEKSLSVFYSTVQTQANAMVADAQSRAEKSGSTIVGIAYPVTPDLH